jgi:hypothetical protein
MPRRGQETASERGISTDKIALILVVVQAVAGSSPVAHPHEVAAQNLLLRQRHSDSARAELPIELPILRCRGEFGLLCEPGSPRLRAARNNRLSAEHVAKAGAVAEAFESVSERRAV